MGKNRSPGHRCFFVLYFGFLSNAHKVVRRKKEASFVPISCGWSGLLVSLHIDKYSSSPSISKVLGLALHCSLAPFNLKLLRAA